MKRWPAHTALLVYGVLVVAGCGANSHRRTRGHSRAPAEYRLVTTGQYHTCASLPGNQVACWGLNQQGQLGDGTHETRDRPVLAHVEGAVDVDAGAWQTCAMLDGGEVRCWGGGHEQITQETPSDLKGLHSTARVVAVGLSTCTITLTGKVLCWTAKEGTHAVGHGQPYLIPLLRPAIELDVGVDILCALMAADDAACYFAHRARHGYRFEPFDPPVRVQDLEQLSVGGNHVCATGLGPMVCWGDNSYGQVGDDPREWVDQPIYVNVRPPSEPESPAWNVIHVSVGYNHSCAVTANGAVSCWGDNSHGQLGDGTRTNRKYAAPVEGIPAVALRVAAGRDHSCAITLDRALYCWGRNDFGQLGVGDREDRITASRVLDPEPRRRRRRR